VWPISPRDDRDLNEHIRLFTLPQGDGAPAFWGDYSGVFLDPDGHPWEVAHNPAGRSTRTGRPRFLAERRLQPP
jgi:hypothetical protein